MRGSHKVFGNTQIDAEELYDKTKGILQCKNFGQLWIYRCGFCNDPGSYILEDDTSNKE